jgi:hypothetical protein
VLRSHAVIILFTAFTSQFRYVLIYAVAKEQPYNHTCDIYAFAIVIWEITALKQPYAKYNVHKMFQQVYNTPHIRPNLEEVGEEWLADLLDNMWTPTISERYSIDHVMLVLNEQMKLLKKHQQQGTQRGEQGDQDEQ